MIQQNNNPKALDRFCINVTQQAREGLLDPVIGRHEEIRRVIHILSRRTKNNPLLLGDPGVGKTAIVEGIAQRIINNDVPKSLQSSVIYSLDLGLLLAGTKFQGEFEERLKLLLKEIEEIPHHTILFIDEIHTIVGAGGAGSALDASNLLKPKLARGELHCIGATTFSEYKKYIEKDAALERRFQKVLVEEPSFEDALSIVRGLKERYELHHGIKIKDQALIAAVNLSTQYIPDRFLPDKAIDLIDEAAASLKMEMDSYPAELDRLERIIKQLEIEKVALSKEIDENSKERLNNIETELKQLNQEFSELKKQWENEKIPLEKISRLKSSIEREELLYQAAEREGNYERASKIKYGTLVDLKEKLNKLEKERSEKSHKLIKEIVDEDDIAQVVSRWTGIPAEKLSENESNKLINLASLLKERVVGQDQAIEEIVKIIQIHRAQLFNKKRPLGSFLFLGPTGVGKTEIVKALAEILFNDDEKIIRLDMSEFMEKHSISRLIGSPPGYIGFEQGGQLTESLRRNPYSIILFDEFEKAHQDIWNILLQLLDEGHITDNQGRKISTKHAIIVLTSNLGASQILSSALITKEIEDEIFSELKKIIRPELLNRIDSIIMFNKLGTEAIKSIILFQLKELQKLMQEQHIRLFFSDTILEWINKEAYTDEFGARPIKRFIQNQITYKIAQYLLKKEHKPNEINIDYNFKTQELMII